MRIILDDITGNEKFYPFTAIRSVADLRAGIFTVKEKWEYFYDKPVMLLSDFSDQVSHEDILINAHTFPSENGAVLFNDPWEIIEKNNEQIIADFEIIRKRISQKLSSTNKIIGDEKNIFIEEGVKAECCIFNTLQGPIFLGKNAEIMEGSILRGPVAICENAIIKLGSKIYSGTTIGPNCIVGGEIKNSILIANSNKAHDGYLGDSMIGEWCNMGAGTSNSNLKNTAGIVKVWNNETKNYITKGKKHGLLMGDYSRCAINTSFNTGTLVGICCNIFDTGFPPKYIQDFSWGNERYELSKAINDIKNWKALKGKQLNKAEEILIALQYSK